VRGPVRSAASWLIAAYFLAGAVASAAPPPADLAAKAQQGKEAMAAGRYDEAATLYGDIVRALPGEAGMLLNLGMAESMAGRPRAAIPHLRAAVKLQPGLSPAWLFLGAVHMQLAEPARAIEPLQNVVAAQPDNVDARQMLGEALLSVDRFDTAAHDFRRLAELASKDARTWYGLGRSYEGLARGAFESLQRSAPQSHYLLILVAQAMAAEGRLASAFPLYREALAKQPGLAEVHEALAQIYEQKGHPEWAALERERSRATPAPDCRSRSLECDFRAGRYQAVLDAVTPPTTAEGRYWLSRAAHELARKAFGRLGQLPPSPEATLVRVDVLRAQRQPLKESIEELQKAAATWPEDRRIRRELATRLFLGHDYAEARELLEQLRQAEPDSTELALMLGQAWLEPGEPAKALPFLQKAVGRDPRLLPAQAALGRAFLEAGDAARAIPHLEAAVHGDKDGSLHYQLARAYRAAGRADLASQALQKFQEIRRSAEARAQSMEEEFKISPP
jgi:predicted Zn-dependent protease